MRQFRVHWGTVSEVPEISVVVPTLREAENIPILASRIAAALMGKRWELIIVDDDSRDGTEEVCNRLAESVPLRLVVRRPPKDGLGGAVLEGFRHARGTIFVVMDADLQHPPEKIPELVAALDRGDFALGSRYTAGGSIEGSWSPFRAVNSNLATFLARPFAPGITDPMSGFFALRRTTYEKAERLTPLGYKIALELMCKCRVARRLGGGGVVEIPIQFGQRAHGRSKLSAREQFRYLEHLSRLYDYTFPRASPVLKFVISVVLGWAPALAWYLSLSAVTPLARVALSYPLTVLVTALLHYRYVNAQREFIPRPRPWLDFWLISALEYGTALAAAAYLQYRTNQAGLLEFFLLTYFMATVTRYILRKELLHDIRGLRRDPRHFQ